MAGGATLARSSRITDRSEKDASSLGDRTRLRRGTPVRARVRGPIRFTTGGAPLAATHLYPSPRIYDIDRDGDVELVVCDLRGRVQFAEKAGDGQVTWGELESVKTDERLLKFNNW